MKTKRTITIPAVLFALLTILALGASRMTRKVALRTQHQQSTAFLLGWLALLKARPYASTYQTSSPQTTLTILPGPLAWRSSS
jgi:hypothetical protein